MKKIEIIRSVLIRLRFWLVPVPVSDPFPFSGSTAWADRLENI